MHILVVSADPDVPRLLATLLPDPSWHLVGARGVREALRALVDTPPDVVLADAKLPEVAALLGMVRRVPGGDDALVVVMGHGASTPREADHVVKSSGALLEILDLVRADERRRAEGRPRVRPASPPPSSERPTLPGADPGSPGASGPAGPLTPSGGPGSASVGAHDTRVERVFMGFDEAPTRNDARDPEAPTRPGVVASGTRPARLPSGEAATLPGTWEDRSAGTSAAVPLPAPRPRPSPQALDSTALQKRLQTELRSVEGGNPWAVLALTRGADASVLEHAADRMRARYAALETHADPVIRHLAGRMRIAVDVAHARLVQDLGAAAAAPAPSDRDDRWEAVDPLEAGHVLLREARWEEADAWFETARDRLPGEPQVLAGLGWARYHNPRQPRDTREDDGIALLELASQFDPRFVDAHLRLAQIHAERGDLPRARDRARAATRAAPERADAAQCLREVEQRLARGGGR